MGRTAIVTGGTRGLGREIAIALKADGHRVAASYAGNDAAAEKFKAETQIPVYKWDVADFAACREGVARVQAALGPVEILVNNAGITGDSTLHKMTPELWSKVIATDLTGVFNMCRNVIEGMRERKFGRIVNISSVNGQRGQFGQTNYAAAKAGMLGFTKSLALEGAAKGITVNAIAPGYCHTDMVAAVPPDVMKTIIAGIPAGRLGTGEDIARAVVFLAQDKSDYISGATFSINGGLYMI